MACFYCTSFDQHLFVVNEMLKSTIRDMEALCTGLANKELKTPSVDATLIYNDLVDIQAYLLKLRDSPEDLTEDDSDFFDEDAFEVETVPDSPVFQSASATATGSSVLPRSDACSDLSLSGPLAKIKKLNEELAKNMRGPLLSKNNKTKKMINKTIKIFLFI